MIQIKSKPDLMLTSRYGGEAPVTLLALRYQATNGLALMLVSNDGIGEPVLTCTVCAPEIMEDLDHDEVCIKDYSENEGIMEWLVESGICLPPERYFHNGFVRIPIARISPDILQEIKNSTH